MNELILGLIGYYASIYGVDPRVAYSVGVVESNLNPKMIGQAGEVGIFQVMPSTAKLTRKQLLDPETNIREGVKYLAQMKKDCIHKEDIYYLVCYNYGLTNAKKVKHPNLFPYVKKVKSIMQEKFKEGDKVIVKGLFNFTVDGPGIYKREVTEGYQKGYFVIENEYYHMMNVHPDRVIKGDNNE